MIDQSVVLACAQEQAFALFTSRASDWWPPSRRHTGDELSAIFLLESGRFYERARDGREVELGKVREWDAPRRIVLDFYIGTDAAHPTEVEIRFAPEGQGTRVQVLHREGPESAELFAKRAPAYAKSWAALLAGLAALDAR